MTTPLTPAQQAPLARQLAAACGLPVDPQEDLAALLSEAAVELENLDGSRNVVAKRLRAMMRLVDDGEFALRDTRGFVVRARAAVEARQREAYDDESLSAAEYLMVLRGLEGRLEQLAAIEAWLVGNALAECEPVVRIADGQGVAELKV